MLVFFRDVDNSEIRSVHWQTCQEFGPTLVVKAGCLVEQHECVFGVKCR